MFDFFGSEYDAWWRLRRGGVQIWKFLYDVICRPPLLIWYLLIQLLYFYYRLVFFLWKSPTHILLIVTFTLPTTHVCNWIFWVWSYYKTYFDANLFPNSPAHILSNIKSINQTHSSALIIVSILDSQADCINVYKFTFSIHHISHSHLT